MYTCGLPSLQTFPYYVFNVHLWIAITPHIQSCIFKNVWSDGNPQVYIKDSGWNVWSDGNPQVYIKDIGWNVWSDGNPPILYL
jgi:hypothetical protein